LIGEFFCECVSVRTDMTDIIVTSAWARMWCLAFAVWVACKLITWSFIRGTRSGFIAYLAWPGMDPTPFVARVSNPCRTAQLAQPGTGWKPVLRGTSGLALIALAGSIAHPLLCGWLGMIGVVLFLHFGLFDLLAIFWRSRGVGVEPIMQQPLRATSLADFWSRWNRGFRDLAFRLIFRPVHRRFGAIIATLAVFVFSGVVHDLVISVPARGGYGLPTLYFLIQGIAILFEKSALGKRLSPLVRRLTMYIALVAPLPLLFHRPFVLRVIVPFIHFLTRCNMTIPALATLLRIGGVMHFGILIASALVPQVLDWRAELRKLAPLSRQLVWVHGVFIVLTIVALGAIATVNAPQLAVGGMLGRSVCAFVAIFWLARLALQFVLFDPREYLTSALLKLGYHSLTLVFAYIAIVFAFAAINPL